MSYAAIGSAAVFEKNQLTIQPLEVRRQRRVKPGMKGVHQAASWVTRRTI
jgi:hypothetical protein